MHAAFEPKHTALRLIDHRIGTVQLARIQRAGIAKAWNDSAVSQAVEATSRRELAVAGLGTDMLPPMH